MAGNAEKGGKDEVAVAEVVEEGGGLEGGKGKVALRVALEGEVEKREEANDFVALDAAGVKVKGSGGGTAFVLGESEVDMKDPWLARFGRDLILPRQ